MTNSCASRLTFLLVILLTSPVLSLHSEDTYGFTLQELQSALSGAGLGTRRICNIQTFGSRGMGTLSVPAYVAVLSTSRSGWEVSVFRRVKGGFQLEWVSRKLPNEFSVSSPDHLSIEDVGDEPVVLFSGCAPHLCDGVGGVAGFLAYSTLRKETFFARYSGHNEYDTSGSTVTFSQNALETKNQQYKQALQRGIESLTRLDKPTSTPKPQ